MGIQPHGLALLSKQRNLSSHALTTLSGEIASNWREVSHYRRFTMPMGKAEPL
jgi:hypothetical protein